VEEKNTKKTFRKTFLANFLIMIGICILIYWIFFGSLSLITRHNDVKTVPNFIGMKVDSAIAMLEKQGFDIKIDSIFDKTKGLHEVVDQQPEVGARVKSGRIIFLTVNKANPPIVTLPNLIGKSYRTIDVELMKVNLVVGDTTEVYDIAVGTVLAMKINGQEVKAGTKVPEGTSIDLVVSKGLGDTKVNIPDLIGLKLPEAIKLLEESGLNYDIRVDGKITDSATALIYEQYPSSKNDYGETQKVWIGDQIEVRYKQSPVIEKRTYLKRDHVDTNVEIIDISEGQSDVPQSRPSTKSQTDQIPSANTNSNSNPNPPASSTNNDGTDAGKKRRPTR